MVRRAALNGRYPWLSQPQANDLTVAFDGPVAVGQHEQGLIAFDCLLDWRQRSMAEHRVTQVMAAIRMHPAVADIKQHGFRLIDFAEYRLRGEVARLWRGWMLARALAGTGARDLICDPALPPALVMGIRAGMGLDPRGVRYTLAPALAGSRSRRALARQLTRVVARASRPGRVRVAAVVAGKLSLALAALSDEELRAAGLGLMPFPGLDHGNGLLLALRRRLPLFGSCGSGSLRRGPPVNLPAKLDLVGEAELDLALTWLLGKVLSGAAPELDQAASSLAGMRPTPSLRALLLPSGAYGASRLLIEWARERGLRIGVMQHGIYAHSEFDGGDRHADVIFGWGEATAEQLACRSEPRPLMRPVGVPGLSPSPALRSRQPTPGASLCRVLIATSNTVETPLTLAAFCETFLDTLAPGIERLLQAGVQISLRPHPGEDAELYRRLLRARGWDVSIASSEPFAQAAANTDLLISSASSVAFEAAALGLPVLLWLGSTPSWVRAEHLVVPWTQSLPGMFETPADLESLVMTLLDDRQRGMLVAHELSVCLARYAQPFRPAAFATGLRALSAQAPRVDAPGH